ncbi:hypothetical protein Y1Q_0005922 [Alligator mississippiensis]|uniref:DDE Tnp4 domain-containing protein n=1 Tax=Alligator mississippiensis TaxID=8496 RepID=A0A151P6C2_ALLMI|nr:hypothetical protein Y1Q_0005922 [Alligator mississippiensis]
MLGPHVMRQNTNMRQAIPPDERVAVAIMKLASSSSLRYVMNQFGMAACMVGLVTHEVCQLLNEIASNKMICLANLQQITDGFNKKGFPNCVEALGSTHIPMLCPAGRGRAFTNRKGYASVILQGMVNHWGCFMNIYSGRAGRAHDAHTFRNSPLTGLMAKGHYAPRVEETVICRVAVPTVTLADAAYPLKSWLTKPYGGNVTDRQKLVFNYCLSSYRMAVGYAFGRLKG